MFNSNSACNRWNFVHNINYAWMWQSTFFLEIVLPTSTAIICQQTWSALFKINFCDIRATVFLQSYVIMPGGRLPETENKRIYQISGPKSGRDRFGNSGRDRLRESFWNSVWLRNKRIICKVVAYGRWSLTRSGRYERVDCNKAYRRIPKISPSLYCWFSVSRHSK